MKQTKSMQSRRTALRVSSAETLGALFVTLVASGAVLAAEPYSPNVGKAYPEHVYWGDTHIHTSLSVDAYILGNRFGPDLAYRFARGDEVVDVSGVPVRLARPLDFAVAADHSEYLGLFAQLASNDPVLLKTEVGKRWSQMLRAGGKQAAEVFKKYAEFRGPNAEKIDTALYSNAFRHSIWEHVTRLADHYNDPGRFTTLIGYEWSPDPYRHRNIIFRDGGELARKIIPFSGLESKAPEELWKFLADYERKTGGRVLAITHNGNASQGTMFASTDSAGNPIDRSYAQTRIRWEPLNEVTQTKGDSETAPYLSPDDEFASFGKWDQGSHTFSELHESWMYPFEYTRSALKNGLTLQAKLGVNPFKVGMVGGTDIHTSLSTADDDNFWGAGVNQYPSSLRAGAVLPSEGFHTDKSKKGWSTFGGDILASGYTGVWATANTRAAIFEAMERKEVYATTGPRIALRMFGGWDFQKDDAFRADVARVGYTKGVPMGGDLTNAPSGKRPTFLIRAVKDPSGANLDRAQVIKGWLDKDGKAHEKVYNVALSDGRTLGKDGKAAPVGSTVDIKNASYTNTIGAPELAVVWTDPDFRPSELAFYYVRVLEIPTPRWPAYDAKYYNIENMPPEIALTAQERAYGSPIWYTPSGKCDACQ